MQSFVRSYAAQGPSRVCAAVAAALALAGCHHDSHPAPQKYTVGGTVTGLSGSLVLKDNAADDLSVSTGGGFNFATPLASGSAYSVTVASQPVGQTCVVSNGSGTVSSRSVTNVQVTCKDNTYSIGGTISGLTAGGLVLANGTDTVSPAAQATSFVFPTAVTHGTAYSVSVQTQPSGQSCTVTAGMGSIATTNVTTVQVTCNAVQPTGQWLWLGGPDIADQSGVYGTQGTGVAGNIPGARSGATAWVDALGKLWLFGGAAPNNAGPAGAQFNDLWSYDPAAGIWTWVSGSNVLDAGGVYGTKGAAAAANLPGARDGAVSWVDAAGNLWLFGGRGRDSTRAAGMLNDLWKYDIKAGQWIWVSGSSTVAARGVYGIQGQPASANTPGARSGAAGWVDASGGLWLFGGTGYDSNSLGMLDDVWKLDPNTGQWSWMSGPDGVDQSGLYGPKGDAGAGSLPGGRWKVQLAKDASGKVWMYGGQGYDATGQFDSLADLWSYDPSMGQWAWMGGSKVIDTGAVYGTLAAANPNNTPGSRSGAVTWVDAAGNLWLTGGDGYDTKQSSSVTFDDLWEFDPRVGQWTWVGGPNSSDGSGVYGTLGAPSQANTPGARSGAAAWLDAAGNLWMFGGFGFDSEGLNGRLNDLWELAH